MLSIRSLARSSSSFSAIAAADALYILYYIVAPLTIVATNFLTAKTITKEIARSLR